MSHDPFAEARRSHWTGIADAAEHELLAWQLDDLERRVGRREAGRCHAQALGLPHHVAPLVGALVYSWSKESRARAARQISRALLREAA